MSTEATIAGGIAIGVVFGLIFFVILAKNYQLKRLEQRVWALEQEFRPADGEVRHWLHKGERRCGNFMPNTRSTMVEAHVTCSDCRRLMNFDRGMAA